jgi:hypothetical protein
MRIRNVVLNVIASASPRTSGPLAFESSSVRKVSRAVWREKEAGFSGTAMAVKDSAGEMAVAFALRMPYLSQERYLAVSASFA